MLSIMKCYGRILLSILSLFSVGIEASINPQVEALRREVKRHDQLYFCQAEPEISDAAYDALKRKLTALETRPSGLGQAVVPGPDWSGRRPRAAHIRPMRSLHKARGEAGVQSFHWELADRLGSDRLDYVVEPKVDGMAISVVFENGRLVRVLSRGNGREGEVLTDNFRAAGLVPEQLPQGMVTASAEAIPGIIELRGEAYIPWDTFHQLNTERRRNGLDSYADPRSLAVGSVRLGNPAMAAERGLRLVFFDWGAWLPEHSEPGSYLEFRRRLIEWGLPVLEEMAAARDAEGLVDVLKEMTERRTTWPYASDGLVIKLNATADRLAMGHDATGPNWALALKFVSEQVATILEGITWQVGPGGRLTPVAELQAVKLGGRVIRRATLHNRDFISAGDFRIGDTVLLELAGGVIPQLLEVDPLKRPPKALPPSIPEKCPACEAVLVTESDSPVIRCDNPVHSGES